MPIRWSKADKCWRFEFDRYIQGSRKRASRLLPRGWSQAKADEFDRAESARLYAVANGIEKEDHLIDTAVTLYLQDKTGLKSYRSAAEHLAAIAFQFTGRKLSEFADVAAKIAAHTEGARPGTTISAATIRNRMAVLKAACRWAWKAHGLTPHDPTARMQMPTVKNERHVYVGRREVGALAWAADRRDLRALILMAFYTGMRLGELLRAEVDGNRLVLSDTKNGDRRAIPIHPHAQRLLRRLPRDVPKITLQRAFQRARDRVGMAHLHFHDLRHSAASEMVNAGVPLHTIGAVLGHRDARSTKRYAHLHDQTLTDAVGKIGRKSPQGERDSDKKKAP